MLLTTLPSFSTSTTVPSTLKPTTIPVKSLNIPVVSSTIDPLFLLFSKLDVIQENIHEGFEVLYTKSYPATESVPNSSSLHTTESVAFATSTESSVSPSLVILTVEDVDHMFNSVESLDRFMVIFISVSGVILLGMFVFGIILWVVIRRQIVTNRFLPFPYKHEIRFPSRFQPVLAKLDREAMPRFSHAFASQPSALHAAQISNQAVEIVDITEEAYETPREITAAILAENSYHEIRERGSFRISSFSGSLRDPSLAEIMIHEPVLANFIGANSSVGSRLSSSGIYATISRPHSAVSNRTLTPTLPRPTFVPMGFRVAEESSSADSFSSSNESIVQDSRL